MEKQPEWLIKPSCISSNTYAQFYKYLFDEDLAKPITRALRNYTRSRILKKNMGEKSAIADELNFHHEFRYGVYKIGNSPLEDIRAVSYIMSGIKIDPSLNHTLWDDESSLHMAVRKPDNKMVIAALLVQHADTSLLNFERKTALQVIKKLALRDTQFCLYESCLKRYIWHKHILLHKRFSEKWGVPFVLLPAEVVAMIAEKTYGSYT